MSHQFFTKNFFIWTCSIDRFQVSHFRPVVMEIEIGGRSEKSLGGQESAAVDQECMHSNANSLIFGLCHSFVGCFSFELVFCRWQRVARSNEKRNRTVNLIFTKNITTYGHHFMRKIENGNTQQPAHRKICLTPITCIDMHFQFLFSLLLFFFSFKTHLHSLVML